MEENKTQEEQLAEQALVRREKLKKLVSEGNDPYQKTKYGTDASSVAVKENYGAYEGKTVSVAGRLMSRRIMGKASFSHISDRDGQIQLYITRQDVGEDVTPRIKRTTTSATSSASAVPCSRRRRGRLRFTQRTSKCCRRRSCLCPKSTTGLRT